MTEQTKKLLSKSFKNFLNKKSLNKITIKDIVDDCKLTRQTFYYHFQDIYALLEWTYNEEIGNLLLDPQNKSLSETMKTIMSYINENKYMFKNTLQSIGREDFEKIIYPDLHKFNKHMIKNSYDSMALPDEKFDFLANMLTSTIISIIIKWVNEGMSKNIHHCVEMLSKTISVATFSVLEEYQTAKNIC